MQGGDGGEAPWDSSGDMTRGQAPHSINHQHGTVNLCRPTSIGPENLPQPLEHYSGLFWPHGQSSYEQQVHGQSLPRSAVLPTCIRAESHPRLGLSSCCWSSGWVFRSSLKNQKTFRKIMSKGLLLFCGEQGLSGSKGWSEQWLLFTSDAAMCAAAPTPNFTLFIHKTVLQRTFLLETSRVCH